MFDPVNCWLGHPVGNVDQSMPYSSGPKVKPLNTSSNALLPVVTPLVCEDATGAGIGGSVTARLGKAIDGADVAGTDGWNVYEAAGPGVSCAWPASLVSMADLMTGAGSLEIRAGESGAPSGSFKPWVIIRSISACWCHVSHLTPQSW